MGHAVSTVVSVSPREVIGVLAWWAVMLLATVVLIRRRRRHNLARRGALRRLTGRAGRSRQPLEGAALRSPNFADDARRSANAIPALEHDAPVVRSRSEPALVGTLAQETLEPLCRYVDFHRRLELAVAELETKLSELPADLWRIEPYPLTGERRNTLVVIGETGVFVLSATYAPGHWDDVVVVDKLARKVQLLLPGYSGVVQPAICHPFTPTRPRLWHRADEHGDWIGAWLLGGEYVLEWLQHFSIEHGLNSADLRLFDQLSKPNWLKPAIPTPPSWPPIQETAPSGAQE